MDKKQVVDVVVEVLEAVIKRHAASGRHEINRTELAAALEDVRVQVAAEKPVREVNSIL